MEMDSAGPNAKRARLAAALHATETSDPRPTVKEPPPPGAGGDAEEAVDSISHLPDAVLGEIISLLPTKDGARTQTLASLWRYLWRAAPLNLDCCDFPVNEESSVDDEYVLPSAILAAHQGTGRRFRFPARCLLNRATTVDAWLRSPALDNLEELEFYYVPKYYDVSSPPPVSLPTSISRFSSTLRIATISQCDLPDDTVETLRFPLLRKLALVQVKISEGSLHRIIAVSCPGLECLMLSRISGIRYLRINSPCIRRIGVRAQGRELVIEDAPLLESLLQLNTRMDMQISVISAPKLETLGCIPEWYRDSRVVFGFTIIQGLRIDNLITVICTVKILAVGMYIFNLDMVIDLMRCFPCLEKLYIKGCQSGEPNLWRRKHRNFLRCSEIQLKTIVLGYYRGIRAQVNFATFFVLNARSLESMRLQIESFDYNEHFFAEQHSRLQMEKRASKVARLYFMKNCRHCVSNINHVNDLDLTDPFECAC